MLEESFFRVVSIWALSDFSVLVVCVWEIFPSIRTTARNTDFPKAVSMQRNWRNGRLSLPLSSSFSMRSGETRAGAASVSSRDGVIIVDHGSRRPESNDMLHEFVAMFRNRTGYPIVEPAHMELATPSIKDAFSLCVEKGANKIIVSPFFLFPGRHWYQDIPSLAAEAAKEYSGISYLVTAPLGLHELLVDVMNDRISHCLRHVAGEVEECQVCAGSGKCRLHW